MFVVRWVVVLLLSFVPAPLLAQWQVAETTHFRLHGGLAPETLAERARLLEAFHALLVQATARTLPAGAPRLDVFVVDSIADMPPRQKLPPGAAGYYLADAGRISAVTLAHPPEGPGALSAPELLLHEYAHHFMTGAGRFAYPAWYLEGFAEYFATARFGARRIMVGEPSAARRKALATGRWLPMETLLARSPDLSRGQDAAMFYAQSWLLTHYMFRTPAARRPFADYLRAQAAGADPVQAFRTHVDGDLPAFEAKLRRYLKTQANVSSFERPGGPGAAVRLSALPPGAERLLPMLVRLEHSESGPESAAMLEAVQALVGDAPEEALARRTLALAQLEAGDPVAAGRLLDGLLRDQPDDADLLRWRARAVRAERAPGAQARALDYLVRALSAAPEDWRVLHAYARLQRGPGGAMPAHALEALLKAHTLAPQVSEIVLDTALALSQAGRLADAVGVLEPLAWAPHGGPASDIAQRMLARARAGDREGLLAEVAALQLQQATRIAAVRLR
jgi:tetratricopeptide (TPR) repeat protein